MEKLPLYLVYFRLCLGALAPVFAFLDGHAAVGSIVVLVLTGFIADIFDGIVARWLNVSTVQLRVLDSIADRVFWIFVVTACFMLYPEFMKSGAPVLILVFAADMLVYVVSLVRFGKIPSPHNLLTKLWGILIAVTFVMILLSGSAGFIFWLMIAVGFISRMDSLLIYLVIKNWDHDIPSVYHAWQARQGKAIRRNKLLNG